MSPVGKGLVEEYVSSLTDDALMDLYYRLNAKVSPAIVAQLETENAAQLVQQNADPLQQIAHTLFDGKSDQEIAEFIVEVKRACND